MARLTGTIEDALPHDVRQVVNQSQNVTVCCGYWAHWVHSPYSLENDNSEAITVNCESYRTVPN